MLEGLEKIPWYRLSHAYDDATNVPEAIRNLANNDEEKYEQSMEVLWNHLYHQGTIFEATAYAVPFLIELLQEPSCQKKADILHYLAHLGTGNSYLEVHQHMIMNEEYKASDQFQETLAQEQNWVNNTYNAVIAGVPVYLQLLTDNDAILQNHAAYTLGACSQKADKILPSLHERLVVDTDVQARASMIFCLALLGSDKEKLFLQELLENESSSMIRVVIARCLCHTMGEDIPYMAVKILVENLIYPEKAATLYAESPWVDYSYHYASSSEQTIDALHAEVPEAHQILITDITGALSLVGAKNAELAIPLLLDGIQQVHGLGVLGIVESLLCLAFDKPFIQDPTSYLYLSNQPVAEIPFESLTQVQKEVLTAIATHECASKIADVNNITLLLESGGLPDGINRFRKDVLALKPISNPKPKGDLQNSLRFPSNSR